MNSSLLAFSDARSKAVTDGFESHELAALMVEKFAEGMFACGVDVLYEADRICGVIDPHYKANRQMRYKTVAKLDLSQKRGV